MGEQNIETKVGKVEEEESLEVCKKRKEGRWPRSQREKRRKIEEVKISPPMDNGHPQEEKTTRWEGPYRRQSSQNAKMSNEKGARYTEREAKRNISNHSKKISRNARKKCEVPRKTQ